MPGPLQIKYSKVRLPHGEWSFSETPKWNDDRSYRPIDVRHNACRECEQLPNRKPSALSEESDSQHGSRYVKRGLGQLPRPRAGKATDNSEPQETDLMVSHIASIAATNRKAISAEDNHIFRHKMRSRRACRATAFRY